MERRLARESGVDPPLQPAHSGSGEFLFSDEAMCELKRQAAEGCLLCELEQLDEEDWE